MDLSALAIFALALLVNAGSPGPSVAALVARVLVRGWRDVTPFLMAMWVGEIVWLTCAVAGLAALAERFHLAFLAVKYCGIAYLLYLAWQMWTAPANTEGQSQIPERGSTSAMFLTGLALTLGNPKIMVFYLALLPTIVDLHGISFSDWAALSGTLVIVLAFVDLSYVLLAARARRFMKSPRIVRIANRVSAAAMGGAAVTIATR